MKILFQKPGSAENAVLCRIVGTCVEKPFILTACISEFQRSDAWDQQRALLHAVFRNAAVTGPSVTPNGQKNFKTIQRPGSAEKLQWVWKTVAEPYHASALGSKVRIS